MGYKRSTAWKYFQKGEGESAKCKRCHMVISIKRNNIYNMSRHLKAKHPEVLNGELSMSALNADNPNAIGWGMKRVRLWKMFTKLEGEKAQCKYCPAILSYKRGNVCNLGRHFEKKHGSFMGQPPTPLKPETDTGEIPMPEDEAEEPQVANETVFEQDSDENSCLEPMPPDEHSQITLQLVRMIVKELQPLNIVEHAEFREFVHMLNPTYAIPSRRILSRVHIPMLYKNIEAEFREKISQASAVSITVDKWSLRISQTFLSVKAHFLTDGSTLQSALLECVELPQDYTDDAIFRNLERIFSAWEIDDKITAVVTENAPILVSAVKMGDWCHLPCVTHALNAVVQDALGEITELRAKCKALVEFFKKSTLHTATLGEVQKQINVQRVELKQDVITRWQSTFDMLNRLLTSRISIEQSLTQLSARNAPRLTDTDWSVMERICDILKPFDEVATEMANTNDINISKQIILINALRTALYKSNLKDEPREIIDLIAALLGGINNHFSYMDENHLILASSLLDPRFKQHGFSNENSFEKAYQHLIEIASEVQLPQPPIKPAPNPTSFWYAFDEMVRSATSETNTTHGALVELDKYIQDTIAPRSSNPITWWSDRKECYPRLYRLMKERLCIVPSVPSERIFSRGRVLFDERHNKVTSLKVPQIVFLKFNLK